MQLSFTTLTRNVVLLALALAPGPPLPTTGSLFDAVRRDDLAIVKMLLRDGSDVKAPDETGATPLMYAALCDTHVMAVEIDIRNGMPSGSPKRLLSVAG